MWQRRDWQAGRKELLWQSSYILHPLVRSPHWRHAPLSLSPAALAYAWWLGWRLTARPSKFNKFAFMWVSRICPRSREKQMEWSNLIKVWEAWKKKECYKQMWIDLNFSWKLSVELSQLWFDFKWVVFLPLFIPVTIVYVLLLKMLI